MAKGLEDWRLKQFGEMVIGGKILHPDRLGYLLPGSGAFHVRNSTRQAD